MISQGQFLGHQDGGGIVESQTRYMNMEAEKNNAIHLCHQIGNNNNIDDMDTDSQLQPPKLLPEVLISPSFGDVEQPCSSSQIRSRSSNDSDSDVEIDADLDSMDKIMPDLQNDETGNEMERDYVKHVRGGMKTRGNRRPLLLTERMRQKRQTLQDMARPLKAWLYEHRDNPYPTKTEKMVLAVGSQMTLVQVSNWFANARRRLKNTVRQPGLTWSKRIKMYNSHVTGSAERLSISSTSSSIYDEELQEDHSFDEKPSQLNCYETTSNISSIAPSTTSQDHTDFTCQTSYSEGAQHKYQHSSSIMNRYLNDSFEHAQRLHHHRTESNRRRNGSGTGSVSSHDYEDVSLSRLSPGLSPHSEESNDISGHLGSAFFEDSPFKDLKEIVGNPLPVVTKVSSKEEDDTYWKEIIAAVALTNMARASRQQRPIITM